MRDLEAGITYINAPTMAQKSSALRRRQAHRQRPPRRPRCSRLLHQLESRPNRIHPTTATRANRTKRRMLSSFAEATLSPTAPMHTALSLTPTILAGVTPAMRIAREEVFGPVAALLEFSTFEEAVEIANSVDYGLSTSVYTRDVNRAFTAMRDLKRASPTSTHPPSVQKFICRSAASSAPATATAKASAHSTSSPAWKAVYVRLLRQAPARANRSTQNERPYRTASILDLPSYLLMYPCKNPNCDPFLRLPRTHAMS